MNSFTNYKQLVTNLDTLKLKQMALHLDEVIDKVSENSISFTEGLIKLTEHEIDFKELYRMEVMVKTAAFPHKKGLDEFDFSFQPNLSKAKIMDLATLRFLESGSNVVFLGPSGVGKTHLATGIGLISARLRYSTYFIKCHDLIMQLKKAMLENRLESRLKHFARYKCLIIDEIGYLPINPTEANLLFQLIDKRYENKSTIVTSNIDFSNWDKVFGDPVIADAILNRLLHHSNVIEITGNSYRLKNIIKKE